MDADETFNGSPDEMQQLPEDTSRGKLPLESALERIAALENSVAELLSWGTRIADLERRLKWL